MSYPSHDPFPVYRGETSESTSNDRDKDKDDDKESKK